VFSCLTDWNLSASILAFFQLNLPDDFLLRILYFYGKGAYYRPEPNVDFTAYNYPVDRFDDHTRSAVLLDEKCSPVIITESGKSPVTITLKPWYFKLFYSLRARAKLKNDFNKWWERSLKDSVHNSDQEPIKNGRPVRSRDLASQTQEKDPFILLKTGRLTLEDQRFWRLMEAAFADGGVTQLRCPSYVADQLTFFMELLRMIPSVERIHVVVHGRHNASPDSYYSTPSALAFQKMHRDNLIDSVIDLGSKHLPDGMRPEDLECEFDSHFCEAGNRWVVDQLIQNIEFFQP
jgi:hypothetical protein